MAAEKGRGEYISTYTGIDLDPTVPTADEIRLEDIAHGLAHNCRFAGQCTEFYSVARHSLNVARCLDAVEDASPELQLYGLLHDASEAYLADLPGPIKDMCGAYTDTEAEFMDAVWEWSGLGQPEPVDGRDPWKPVDRGVFRCEVDGLLVSDPLDEAAVARAVERYGPYVDLNGAVDFEATKRAFVEEARRLADDCGVDLR